MVPKSGYLLNNSHLAIMDQICAHHYSRFRVFLFKIGMHVKTVQIEFFGIEIIIAKSSKKLKMGHVQDTPVSTKMILNECMIYHMKVHTVSYNLGQKKFQNPEFVFYLIMNKQTPKRL